MTEFTPALKWPLRAMLDISTGHIKRETLKMLEACDPLKDLKWICYATEYGWFVYAHDDEHDTLEVPEEIAKAMLYARTQGADYILYDCDSGLIPELEAFDHG